MGHYPVSMPQIVVFAISAFAAPLAVSADLPPLPASTARSAPERRVVNYAEGHRYVGEYRDENPHGRGTMTYPNGDRYDGEWRNGSRHGRGSIAFSSGEKYAGEWRDDKMTGRGQMSWPNGDRYEGEIIDGVRNGRGVMTYGDGGRYEGEWRNNEANGRGIMVWPNKQRYEGQWLNGNRHGYGLHVAAPGRQYQGEWRDDKPVDSTLAWGSPSSGSASRSSAQDAPAVAEVKLPEAKRGLVLNPPTPSNVAVARGTPAVALLAATAEPARVKRGDVVRLGMAFRVDVGGSQEIKVEESYELSFQGKPLPNYPVQRAKARGAGEHSSVYSQQIPVAAAPGTYRFKGEVCFDGACSSRVSSFEIGP